MARCYGYCSDGPKSPMPLSGCQACRRQPRSEGTQEVRRKLPPSRQPRFQPGFLDDALDRHTHKRNNSDPTLGGPGAQATSWSIEFATYHRSDSGHAACMPQGRLAGPADATRSPPKPRTSEEGTRRGGRESALATQVARRQRADYREPRPPKGYNMRPVKQGRQSTDDARLRAVSQSAVPRATRMGSKRIADSFCRGVESSAWAVSRACHEESPPPYTTGLGNGGEGNRSEENEGQCNASGLSNHKPMLKETCQPLPWALCKRPLKEDCLRAARSQVIRKFARIAAHNPVARIRSSIHIGGGANSADIERALPNSAPPAWDLEQRLSLSRSVHSGPNPGLGRATFRV